MLPFLVWFVFVACCIVYIIYLLRRFVIAVEKFVDKQV